MSACSIFWGRILWDVGSLPWYILHPQRLRLRETWQIEKMPFFLARDLACFPITVVFIGQLFFSGSFVNPVGHAVINRRFTLHIYIYIYLFTCTISLYRFGYTLYIYIYASCSEKCEPEVHRQSNIFENVFQWGVAQPTKSPKRRTWFLTMPPSQLVRRAAIGRKQCFYYMRCGNQVTRVKENVTVVGEMLQR